ncbi:MAG: DUF3099 domain-containing protein [Pseudonocardia sp.]|nr:DUF3099 domain-containing protein [Pseudonocardia sp.]
MTDRPVLITDAPRSYEEQLAARKRRYATLMAGRLALFVLAAIAYPVSAWLAVGLLALSVPLPWMAVLIANDAPARKGEDAHRIAPAPRPQVQARDYLVIDAPDRNAA